MNDRPTVAALIYCLLVASCTGVPAAMPSGENTADIYHNGFIITVDPSVPEAAAVAVRDQRIIPASFSWPGSRGQLQLVKWLIS